MRFSKAFVLLSSAALAFASDALVSRGIFAGTDSSDPRASGVDVFDNPKNHPAAAASILRALAKEADYWPNEQSAAKMQTTFGAFQKKVAAFNGLFRIGFDEQTFTASDKDDLYNEVEASYPFAESEAVALAVYDMVPKKNRDQDLKNWDLTVAMISKLEEPERGAEVVVTLVEVRVALETSQRGRVHFPKQEVTMITQRFGVLASTLEYNAQRYADKYPTINIDKFTIFMTSPEEPVTGVFQAPPASCSMQSRMAYRSRNNPDLDWLF
ncbi:hypothetical protein BGZ73_007117 [Actinomortierella ambigua]|nr:hypothetical protein BGZ73_007117 [Actinomortierella ambigua]